MELKIHELRAGGLSVGRIAADMNIVYWKKSESNFRDAFYEVYQKMQQMKMAGQVDTMPHLYHVHE